MDSTALGVALTAAASAAAALILVLVLGSIGLRCRKQRRKRMLHTTRINGFVESVAGTTPRAVRVAGAPSAAPCSSRAIGATSAKEMELAAAEALHVHGALGDALVHAPSLGAAGTSSCDPRQERWSEAEGSPTTTRI